MKKIYTLVFLLFLISGCACTTTRNVQLSLDEAETNFSDYKWKPVVCIGIPSTVPGFAVTQHRKGTRTDLKTETNVYVIYEEYLRDPTGRSFCNSGQLAELDKISMSIFRFNSYALLAKQNYIDLIGFAKNRMFKIHAWQNPGATENELLVAQRVAELAIETILKK